MKLTELKGKENLPEKEIGTRCACDGRNYTIDQYNQLEIDGDVEVLAQEIHKSLYGEEITEDHPVRNLHIYSFSKDIISNFSKFLVIKKGG